MGITYNNATATGANVTRKTAFTSRVRVAFTLSGQTDSGLAFGGSIRADNSVGGAAGTAGFVFISGDFGRLTMGDTNGAAEQVVGDIAGVGLTNLGDLNETTFLGNNSAQRPTARYDYTLDGLTLSLSVSNPGVARRVLSVGASYKFDGLTVALGVEQQNSAPGVTGVAAVTTVAAAVGDPVAIVTPAVTAVAAAGKQTHVVASVAYTMDNITAKLVYGRLSTGAVTAAQNTPGTGVAIASTRASQYGLSISGKFDATTVTAFGRRDFAKDTHIGIGASYDLGGGASLVGGIVNTRFNAPVTHARPNKSRMQADVGVSFKF
jgi:outer membrane protein OmpU